MAILLDSMAHLERMVKMNNLIMTVLFHYVSKFMKGSSSTEEPKVDVNKLKLAMGYLMVIKAFRLMYLSLWGASLSIVFLLTGLILIHYSVLVYAPWGVGVKIASAVIPGGLYIVIATSMFLYTFKEERWLKMFNAEKILAELTETESTADSDE